MSVGKRKPAATFTQQVRIAEKIFQKMMVENAKFSHLLFKCCVLHDKIKIIPGSGKCLTLFLSDNDQFPFCFDVFFEKTKVRFSVGLNNVHVKKELTEDNVGVNEAWIKRIITSFQKDRVALLWLQRNYKSILEIQ